MNYKNGLKKMLKMTSYYYGIFIVSDLARPLFHFGESMTINDPIFTLFSFVIFFLFSAPMCIKDFRKSR